MIHVTTLCLFLGLALSAVGAKITFTAKVTKARVGVNERFQITFTIQQGDARSIKAPSFASFHVLSGPNTSSNFSYSSGGTTQSKSFSYILQPRKTGNFQIGAAEVNIAGKVYVTQPLNITVVKTAATVKQAQKSSPDIRNQVFLKGLVNKKEVYQGEQLVASYKIYMQVNIVQYEMKKFPSNKGFWSQDIETSPQIQLAKEVLGGQQYSTGILRKIALFPQVSGDLELASMEVKVTARVVDNTRRRRSIFDDFFGSHGYRDVPLELRSPPMRIKVKPLPKKNRPSDFSGAVGKYRMAVILDKISTKADEPVTVRIKISGAGNIKLLEAPELKLPPDFEVYDPKVTEKLSKSEVIRGSKTFEYLVIPRSAGNYKLPPIEFSYFDLDKKDYITLRSEEFLIEVKQGSQSTGSGRAITGISKGDVELIGEDIRYLKTESGKFESTQDHFTGSAPFFGILLLPFLFFAALLGYLKQQQKLKGNLALLRNRRANKIARTRLTQARKHLKSEDTTAFYDEIAKALWGYLGDKLNIPAAELSKGKVIELLTEKEVRPELGRDLTMTLDTCELALFSPGEAGGGMDSVYEDTAKLISNFEAEIK